MRLKVTSELRKAIGKGSVDLEVDSGATLDDVLKKIDERYGMGIKGGTGKSLKELLKRFSVFVDGKSTRLPADLACNLRNDSEILIARPVGGGSG
ncbi:MAG: MoaD/ThiS family protein [Candidatus Binatia bacterium]